MKLAGYLRKRLSISRAAHLNLMRQSALECYGSKSPQYIALSKKVQQEMMRLKEKEARQTAELKREQNPWSLQKELLPQLSKQQQHPSRLSVASSEQMRRQCRFGAERASVQDPSNVDDSFAVRTSRHGCDGRDRRRYDKSARGAAGPRTSLC